MKLQSKIKLIQVSNSFPLQPEQTIKIYDHHGQAFTRSQAPKYKRKSNKKTQELFEEIWFNWTIKRSEKTVEYTLGDAIPNPYGYCKKINACITSENLLVILNHHLELEINYNPPNYDMLVLYPHYINNNPNPVLRKTIPKYNGIGLSFIYKNDEWTINQGFDHIHCEYNELMTGIAEIVL